MGTDYLLQQLLEFDLRGLYFLNVEMSQPFLDPFWLGVTHLENINWVRWGLFPALMVWFFYKYRMNALKPLLALALAVGLADAISYRLIKKHVNRPRPFQNLEISSWLRTVGSAQGSSFPSNHAANCFAGASILAYYFQRRRRMFYTFAMIVALSRPVLGVHYPSDILAGAFVGLVAAWIVKVFVLHRLKFFRWSADVSDMDRISSGWSIKNRRLADH